jgi:hypothetical protein
MCQGHNDLVRSNGSEHLESVFVESNGFPKQLHERSFGKPAECRFLFQVNAQSAQSKAAVPFRHDFDVKPIDREDGKQSALMGVVIWQKPVV